MKIAVFTKNRTNPAYDGARYAADLIASQHGATVKHYVPDIPDDPAQQSALIREALQDKPDAVLIAPVHLELLRPAMALIEKAGVPVFGLINRVPGVRYVTYVGSDDTALATALARYLFTHMKGKGNVTFIEGPSHSVTNNLRVAAFLAEVARYPDIRIAARIEGDYQREPARAAFTRFLDNNDCPDAVLSANDIMAIGVLEALDAHASKQAQPLIAGINAIPEAIDAIAQGRMLATADFNPMQMAAFATECAVAYLKGQSVPAVINVPVKVVDRDISKNWGRAWESRPLITLKEIYP